MKFQMMQGRLFGGRPRQDLLLPVLQNLGGNRGRPGISGGTKLLRRRRNRRKRVNIHFLSRFLILWIMYQYSLYLVSFRFFAFISFIFSILLIPDRKEKLLKKFKKNSDDDGPEKPGTSSDL